jgi:hypothetical protein
VSLIPGPHAVWQLSFSSAATLPCASGLSQYEKMAANRRQVPELKLSRYQEVRRQTNHKTSQMNFLTPSMEGKLDIQQTRELLEIKTGTGSRSWCFAAGMWPRAGTNVSERPDVPTLSNLTTEAAGFP